MSHQCTKCKENVDSINIVTEGGTAFFFCNECMAIINSFPDGKAMISEFLTPDEQQTQFMKNIFSARRARAKGESLWNSK